MAMADPLQLLRHFNINNLEIVERDGMIIFGKSAWAKDATTNYIKYVATMKKNAPVSRQYYTLECILYLLQNVSKAHTTYVRQCGNVGIPVVNRVDRRMLLQYLNDPMATSGSIDKTALLPVPIYEKKPDDEPKEYNLMIDQLSISIDQSRSRSTERGRDLSAVLTYDVICSIREKKQANNRKTQIANKMKQIDYEKTKNIYSHERCGRTRNSMLQSSRKEFVVLPILKKVEDREAGIPAPVKQPPPPPPRVLRPPTNQYNRYGQEQFGGNGTADTAGFAINKLGTYQPELLKVAPSSQSVAQSSQQQKKQPPPNMQQSRTPIIIVPAVTTATSLICMRNAIDILLDLKFVTPQQKRAQGGDGALAARDKQLWLHRRKRDKTTVRYRIVDDVRQLSADDWKLRVVAVFVMGPKWQFKGWPWNGDPVEIFANTCAFNLCYDDTKPGAIVAGCNVTVLKVSRTKRHLDRASLMVFWQKLNAHMTKNKPNLRF